MYGQPPYVLAPGDVVLVSQHRLDQTIKYFYVCVDHPSNKFLLASKEEPFHKEHILITRNDEEWLPSDLYLEVNAVFNADGVELGDALNRSVPGDQCPYNPIGNLSLLSKQRIAAAVEGTKALKIRDKELIITRLFDEGADLIPFEAE